VHPARGGSFHKPPPPQPTDLGRLTLGSFLPLLGISPGFLLLVASLWLRSCLSSELSSWSLAQEGKVGPTRF
jgi:hypothetical protein